MTSGMKMEQLSDQPCIYREYDIQWFLQDCCNLLINPVFTGNTTDATGPGQRRRSTDQPCIYREYVRIVQATDLLCPILINPVFTGNTFQQASFPPVLSDQPCIYREYECSTNINNQNILWSTLYLQGIQSSWTRLNASCSDQPCIYREYVPFRHVIIIDVSIWSTLYLQGIRWPTEGVRSTITDQPCIYREYDTVWWSVSSRPTWSTLYLQGIREHRKYQGQLYDLINPVFTGNTYHDISPEFDANWSTLYLQGIRFLPIS